MHKNCEFREIRGFIMESFLWYIIFNCFILKVWEWHVEFAFSYRLEWIEDKTENRKTLKHYSSKAFLKRKNSFSLISALDPPSSWSSPEASSSSSLFLPLNLYSSCHLHKLLPDTYANRLFSFLIMFYICSACHWHHKLLEVKVKI